MPRSDALALRLLRTADAAATRLYGWRRNPLHQSGALAVILLALLIVTGLYLLLVYRVAQPWTSVTALQQQVWFGRWMRSLHRFASDALVIAVLVHAWRMFAQQRTWGPRALAWVSGVVLLGLVFISGWTGYVLVWDTFGARLAISGARLLDALPVLSEPVRRIFAGDSPVPAAFFFINLFLHIALPLGAGAGLWIHLSRLARPTLAPPRVLWMAAVASLLALAIARPSPLADEASLLVVPATVPMDAFYAFWMPWADALSPTWAWVGALVTLAIGLSVPALTRRTREGVWAPSVVDPRLCTGCNQCPQDCPWEAITMVPRADGRVGLVAQVDPARCVSCGICAGSCAPMGVGPAMRTGRDQLALLRRARAEAAAGGRGEYVAMCCEHAAPAHLDPLRAAGADVRLVPCAGNVHSSVVERTLRAGADGVIIYSCAPRDCRGREGPVWLHERMYNGREAELQPRVDLRRVAAAVMTPGDLTGTMESYRRFVRSLTMPVPDAPRAAPVARAAVACVVTSVALLFLREASLMPVRGNLLAAAPGEHAVLRLSWSARPERIEQCRRLSDSAMAALPSHMRLRWVCDGTFASYQLAARVDDHVVAFDTVRGGGLRHDRPLHLFREYALPAGDHRLSVSLQRIETPQGTDSLSHGPDSAATLPQAGAVSREARETQERRVRRAEALPPRIALDTVVHIGVGRVMLVTYYDTERRLSLRAAP